MNAVVLERHDGPAQAPAGGDLIPGFELVEHRLPFFLAALLGHDQQKVKNGENKNQGSHTQPPHTATTTELYCHQKLHMKVGAYVSAKNRPRSLAARELFCHHGV